MGLRWRRARLVLVRTRWGTASGLCVAAVELSIAVAGLAFDNFNTGALTVSVPEPLSVWFFGLAVPGLVGLARRRTKRSVADLDQ
jgi:hypothetical protein